MSVWSWVRFLHVFAAILWVGGQLLLVTVVRPAAKRLSPSDRTHLFTEAGRVFARLSMYLLIPMLLATGLGLTWRHGVDLGGLALNSYAVRLWTKVALAIASFAVAVAHGIVAVQGGTKVSRALGIAGALVSLTVVFLATSLVS